MTAQELLQRGHQCALNGDFEQAAQVLEQAIQMEPANPQAYFSLGIVHFHSHQLAAAETCFRQVLQLDPDNIMAYRNMGAIFQQLGQLDQAEGWLKQAIQLNPRYADAYVLLGAVLENAGRLAEAETCLIQAIQLDAHNSAAYINMGTVLAELNRPDQAEAFFLQAVAVQPDNPIAYYDLGALYQENNRVEEGTACLEKALILQPDYPQAECALGMSYLLQGQFAKGWGHFEARRKYSGDHYPDIPSWHGQPLQGATLLLFQEQGMGDALQFVRYVNQIASQAKRVILWVQPPLVELLSQSGLPAAVHTGDFLPYTNIDYVASLLSLPFLCKTRADNIPQEVPYLKPAAETTVLWQKILAPLAPGDQYKVGVVWAGNPNHQNDKNRSIPLDLFQQLFSLPQITWVSLQVGPQREELRQTTTQVHDFAEILEDFAQTAGLMANLDLVITVDTAAAHLAGAMGKETWLLLPFAPDWRWQLGRHDSPWYPTIRIFRQSSKGNWQAVLHQVENEMDKMRGKKK